MTDPNKPSLVDNPFIRQAVLAGETTPAQRVGEMGDEEMTVQQVADRLGVKPSTVATWARQKRLDSFFLGIGRHRRFKKSDVEAFVESRRQA